MYEFIRETRHQRWDDGDGPWSLNRWIYDHLGLTLGALVLLALALRLGDGRVGFSDLLWMPTLVAVPYDGARRISPELLAEFPQVSPGVARAG